ncbi:WD40-repeat-containing domain protein [Irpex lacteus]|nr:WD40-repeat-containing domain protein [Irpex lacteus]
MASPLRQALVNRTNANYNAEDNIIEEDLLPSPERKRPLVVTTDDSPIPKRVKIQTEDTVEEEESDDEDSSDDEDDDEAPANPRRLTTFDIMNARMGAGPSRMSRLPSYSTRPILESFVSSNSSDVFKLHSVNNASYMSPPYACSYSHSSKRGEGSLLAVTTEEGVVHILDTSERQEWEVEPQRSTSQPHQNGVFDVQWSRDDRQLATVSADRSLCISEVSEAEVIPTIRLTHHTSTVKCVTWDPTRDGDVLCSGGRDGMICVWDLRVGTGVAGAGVKPVMVIPKSHDTEKKATRKGKLTAPPARGVTSLLFSEHDQYSLVSSGSYDGILRQWDLRYLDTKRRSTRKEPTIKNVTTPAHTSSADPTLYRGTRRARGITSMTPGSGVTSGLLFALSNDSRIHTYDARTLEPLSGWTTDPVTDAWSYGHDNMRTNSFYIRLAMSPCGRWLASGGQRDGCAYLFDVSASARERVQCSDVCRRGVELFGQKGEVGAVDWAPGQLASCADDGTVRVWRPDVERYRRCEDEPEEMRWNWSWAGERR